MLCPRERRPTRSSGIMDLNTETMAIEPIKDICITLLAQYMVHKKLCAGTIVERLVRMGISPLEAAFERPLKSSVVDTSYDA